MLLNFRAVNNNLGVLAVDLHSNSPEPINFFGAQYSFGGTQAVIWGARPRNTPVAPGLAQAVPLFETKDLSELINMLLLFFSDTRSILQAEPSTTNINPSTVTPQPTTPTTDRRISTVSQILEKVSCSKASSYPCRIDE